MANSAKCRLNRKQQDTVRELALLFLTIDRTGQIFDMKARKVMSSLVYINGVFATLGIKTRLARREAPKRNRKKAPHAD